MEEKNILLTKISDLEKLLNDGIVMLKDFLKDEEGSKLSSWAISGFLNHYTQQIQKGLNTLEIVSITKEEYQELKKEADDEATQPLADIKQD